MLAAAARQPAAGPADFPVAFHYQAHFAPRQLRWYTRFGALVTGAILPAATTDALRNAGRAAGTRLIAYEWASGFYQGDAVSAPLDWQRECESRAAQWLITPKPVTGNAAEHGRVAHWYDFASDELIRARAAMLAERLARSGYDGYFFDTVGEQCLAPDVLAAFRRRHPGMDYNAAQGRFLARLRSLLPPGKLIFLNQGYRHADHLLPHADLDLSESYFTYLGPGGATAFRPWHDASKPWEAIRTPLEQLIEPALRRHPHVRMVHANYAAGDESARRSARYSAAAARLFGHRAYTIVPGKPEWEEDDTYFTELGAPAGPIESNGGAVWRRFQNGLAAINASARPVRIPGWRGSGLLEPWQGLLTH